ncbi:hypothetical protein HETIRDRAFT_428415 [Heterobasidion irregulare TC 32-1]|uniref:CCHC-type domain-containing protein n=1 Tax=Heterobasidion irregulare (strain TC 32-1) TaxID=747525 RepID=W4K534_HETIT|nr:uncharacterized protein HETIRDRAFT_428415 [Heterobasidion irregulare TC 32-1]ETW80156.1 hypothetical protein HETIRDRAFT_428415 [Heterobasidion irregulare TC 32-1]
MVTPSMPTRGDRTAPTFDPHQPHELSRYFANLDFHFVWSVTFKEFCEEVYRLYPGLEEEHKWSVSDMDKLVSETSRVGILSLSELGNYHRQFLAITVFLLSKAQILVAEQGRAFAKGFQPELWARISQRLQLKFPDHFPDDPTTSAYSTTSTNVSRAAPVTPPTNAIKAKDLATMFEQLTDTFVKAIAAQGTSRPANRPSRQPGQGGDNCMFCGSPEHFMRACPEVTKYIRIGKCKRNIEGKVVLSSGAFVPREITGQLATGQMMFTVNAAPTHPSFLDVTPTYQLTNVQRTASLERELFALRTRGRKAPKDDAPIHPYTKAQDATYAPPHECNMGAPAKIPSAKKDAPAYKTTAPIYDEKVREATSAHQSPTKDASNVWTFYQDADLPYAIDNLKPPTRPTVSSFVNVLHQPETPPPGAIIIPDTYETYLKSLQPGQVPQLLIVAKESSALRSIVPLVDH